MKANRLVSFGLNWRAFILWVALAALNLVLAACGDSTDTSPAAGPIAAKDASSTSVLVGADNTQAAKTRVVFWSNDRHDLTLMRDEIEKFNKQNTDNIEIDYQIFTDDYPNLLQLAWQSKQAPDLFISRSLENMPSLVRDGYVQPLDDYLNPALKEQIGAVNFVEGSTTYGGKFYSLPTYASTFRLIYNKDLFKKAGIAAPPTTLAEMVADAKRLSEVGKPDGAYGFAINLKTPSNAWNRALTPLTTRNGARDYNYNTGQYDFTADKPILEAFRQIVTAGSMFPTYQSLDIDPLRSQFADGKIGMYLSISAEVGVYANQFKPKMEWAAAPVPTADPTAKSGSLLGRADWLAMSATSKNKAAAWKVMQWFYRPEFLIRYQEEGYGNLVLPGLSKIARPATQTGSQYFIPDFKNADAVWPVPPFVSKIEGKDFSVIFASYVFGNEPNLDAALADLTTRYNKALARDITAGTVQKLVLPNFDPATLITK